MHGRPVEYTSLPQEVMPSPYMGRGSTADHGIIADIGISPVPPFPTVLVRLVAILKFSV